MTSSYLLLHFLLFLSISFILCPAHGCHEEERTALLNFKSSLDDPSNRLSSWKESLQHRNCCDWHGIRCSDESLHVVSIDLRNTELENYMIDTYDPSGDFDPPSTSLTGKLCDSLFNINHLNYLDLSFNDFHSQEPEILFRFSELTKLTHLDLSYTNFSASISTHFTNISSLVYVDLSCYVPNSRLFTSFCLESSSTKWVRGLANLQVLRLSGIDLFEATSLKGNFAEDISKLSNLRDVDISDCSISNWVFPLHQFHNLSRLSTLKMKGNYGIKFSSIQLQMGNLTSLSILDLSWCNLQGPIPYLPQLKELHVGDNRHIHTDLSRMFEHPWPRLKKLDISYTNATGSVIPSSISNAPQLVSLYAKQCSIQGSLPSSIYHLSRLQHLDLSINRITGSIHSSISHLKELNYLDFSVNKFQGPVPKSICEIFPLRYLHLSYNNMTGTIPSCITKLRNLSFFEVYKNSLRGKVSLIPLINELNLTSLDLSSNELTVIIDQHLQPSKFTLKSLQLESCNMEGFIPSSICNFTLLEEMNFSNNNLTGTIPSCIGKLKKLESINLSKNNLRGHLPHLLPLGVFQFDLSHNKFYGEISLEAGERLSKISEINLNGNELSGSIPSSLCSQEAGKPESIDFSYNKLSGIIPSSIGHCSILYTLKLNNNNLTGKVPNELAQTQLRVLQLNNNNLDGRFPESILRHLGLGVLNLGNNNFEGIIPMGLGSLNDLVFISLRSNKFIGSIPEEILHLQKLQILDLSMNNLSGPIPIKIGNLSELTRSRFIDTSIAPWDVQYQLVIKGTGLQFAALDALRTGVDLSCNNLDGKIPDEIGSLKGLAMLNLSNNHFSNYIPASIGNMSTLDSLDLSSNRLSGHIPQNLTSLDSLGFLNLSHNNLSGRIPRGNHFDTLSLDGSAFAGNDLLCGFPIKNFCDEDPYIDTGDPSSEVDEADQDHGKEKFLLYAIVAMGFAVGFWGLFFVLLINKQKWWFPYWRLVNFVAVKIVEGCIHKK